MIKFNKDQYNIVSEYFSRQRTDLGCFTPKCTDYEDWFVNTLSACCTSVKLQESAFGHVKTGKHTMTVGGQVTSVIITGRVIELIPTLKFMKTLKHISISWVLSADESEITISTNYLTLLYLVAKRHMEINTMRELTTSVSGTMQNDGSAPDWVYDAYACLFENADKRPRCNIGFTSEELKMLADLSDQLCALRIIKPEDGCIPDVLYVDGTYAVSEPIAIKFVTKPWHAINMTELTRIWSSANIGCRIDRVEDDTYLITTTNLKLISLMVELSFDLPPLIEIADSAPIQENTDSETTNLEELETMQNMTENTKRVLTRKSKNIALRDELLKSIEELKTVDGFLFIEDAALKFEGDSSDLAIFEAIDYEMSKETTILNSDGWFMNSTDMTIEYQIFRSGGFDYLVVRTHVVDTIKTIDFRVVRGQVELGNKDNSPLGVGLVDTFLNTPTGYPAAIPRPDILSELAMLGNSPSGRLPNSGMVQHELCLYRPLYRPITTPINGLNGFYIAMSADEALTFIKQSPSIQNSNTYRITDHGLYFVM